MNLIKKPFIYLRNVSREFKKIHWASAKDMFKDFGFIATCSVLLIGFFALLDYLITLVV